MPAKKKSQRTLRRPRDPVHPRVAESKTQNTSLHQSCQRWIGLIRMGLIRINLKQKYGRQNLHECKGMIEKALGENPAVVLQKNNDGKTPLMIVAAMNNKINDPGLNQSHKQVLGLIINRIHEQYKIQSSNEQGCAVITINTDGSVSTNPQAKLQPGIVSTQTTVHSSQTTLPQCLCRHNTYIGHIELLTTEKTQEYQIEIQCSELDETGTILAAVLITHGIIHTNTPTSLWILICPTELPTLAQTLDQYQTQIDDIAQLLQSTHALFPFAPPATDQQHAKLKKPSAQPNTRVDVLTPPAKP